MQSKHINIISRTNGVGHDNDVQLLKTQLEAMGHKVTFSHCRSCSPLARIFGKKNQFDANIFIERIFLRWLGSARKNFLIPNQERYPHRQLSRLKHIHTVLCKSQHALDLFSPHAATRFIGFTSRDVNLSEVTPDYNAYFHLAGKSTLKGSETILEIWAKHPEWPTLTMLQTKSNAPETVPQNVRLITDYLEYEELLKISNQHGIHLCPSRAEGWGHYLVEAMSSSAVVITTDAPPMNEIVSSDRGILIPYTHSEPRRLGPVFYADPEKLEEAIATLISQAPSQYAQLGANARQWYEENAKQFEKRFSSVMTELLE